MSELTTSLQINFANPDLNTPFSMAEDGQATAIRVGTVMFEESVYNYGCVFRISCGSRGCSIRCNRYPMDSFIRDNDARILNVKTKGKALFRLYGSRGEVDGAEFTVFNEDFGDADSADRSVDPSVWDDVANMIPARADGVTLKKIGWREEAKIVTLTWRGEKEQVIPFVSVTGTEPVMISRFFTNDGIETTPAMPKPGAPRIIHHPQPVWGNITLKCAVEYCLYEVTFGLGVVGARLQDIKKQWLVGYWEGWPRFPKLRVLAVTGNKTAEISIERTVVQPRARVHRWAGAVNSWKAGSMSKDEYAYAGYTDGTFSQQGIQTRTQRIESPDDPDVYIDIEVPVAIDFTGSDGKRMTLRFPS
jgi:hypothetical protein